MESVHNVYKKMLEARKIISNTKMNKSGRNKFSNYDYFTPDQVNKLVSSACQEVGLLTLFDLKRTELGYVGVLTVLDVDDTKSIELSLATDMPEIKATNITQKLGGMATYTERYLKMSAFEIVDNNLDFDEHDNNEPKPLPLIDDEAFSKYLEWINTGTKDKKGNVIDIAYLRARHTLNESQENELLDL